MALYEMCTVRSVLVKVPVFSAQMAAGSTTSARTAVSVRNASCTTTKRPSFSRMRLIRVVDLARGRRGLHRLGYALQQRREQGGRRAEYVGGLAQLLLGHPRDRLDALGGPLCDGLLQRLKADGVGLYIRVVDLPGLN